MEGYILLAGIPLGIMLILRMVSTYEKSIKYDELKPKFDSLIQIENELIKEIDTFRASRDIEIKNWNSKVKSDKREIEILHKQKSEEIDTKISNWNTKVQNDKHAIEILYKQKSMGFPWLANAYAEFFALEDKKIEEHLKFKKRPAYQAADAVKEVSQRRREAELRYRVTKYKIEYYENLFPWLSDLIAEDEKEDFLVSNNDQSKNEDSAQTWLTSEEFGKLPTYEKYQLALERYVKRNKTKWEIGRDYERYVGYVWEQEGYKVTYHGIIDGFEDLGRDLIATKNNKTDVIQCKYWSKHKTIHEKHIFQLFGTTMEFWLQTNKINSSPKGLIEFANLLMDERVTPIFITSTSLSNKAKKIAQILNVNVYEDYRMNSYPRIKCNVSSRTKEKIYHLPFDQQYDKILIEPEKGEFYADSVREAEAAGFRRASKWMGNN